jgi:hypothetical protein
VAPAPTVPVSGDIAPLTPGIDRPARSRGDASASIDQGREGGAAWFAPLPTETAEDAARAEPSTEEDAGGSSDVAEDAGR